MRRYPLLAVVLVVLLSACRVDTTVTVDVHDDGSGVVTATMSLDASAVEAATSSGEVLQQAIRTADLEAAGWSTTGWKRRPGGGATLSVSKPFANAQAATAVVAELNGPNGPLRHVRVTHSTSRLTSKWGFSGIGDLATIQPGIVTDPELVQRLTAQRADVNAINLEAIGDIRRSFRFEVEADLPHASVKRYVVPPGKVVVMKTSSSATDNTRIVAGVIAIAAIVLAALIVLGAGLNRRRRRKRRAPGMQRLGADGKRV